LVKQCHNVFNIGTKIKVTPASTRESFYAWKRGDKALKKLGFAYHLEVGSELN
jgi:hypothetical protein